MTRAQLEHLIRAAAVIADEDQIVVIGSQAILGQFPNAPESMRLSIEADLFPLRHPERADIIDGTIGELSPFHQSFGYYAHGVGENTAILPQGWRDRLVVVQNENTRGAQGLCLEIHDLLVAKAIAGRDKDLDFLTEAARNGMADRGTLISRLETVDVEPTIREAGRAVLIRALGNASSLRGSPPA